MRQTGSDLVVIVITTRKQCKQDHTTTSQSNVSVAFNSICLKNADMVLAFLTLRILCGVFLVASQIEAHAKYIF
jgi:hypothetical protein